MSLDDTEPAREPIRIRHLLTHTAGFTYGFLDPAAPIAKAYAAAGMLDPTISLAEQMERLARLPLLFQPGSRWNYSVATDVVGRLVEVLSGSPLDHYFDRHVFQPAGMTDTGFTVPARDASRLTALYVGDLAAPLQPGLARADHLTHPGAYLVPQARLNPGGGLVTSLDDYTRLLQILLRGGAPLLQSQSMRFVEQNQLPEGMWIQFPGFPMLKGRGHSFVSSVTVEAFEGDPTSRPGDLQWGGLAGTHWFYSPGERLGAILMTQRYMGFGLPFWPRFKQAVRASQAIAQGLAQAQRSNLPFGVDSAYGHGTCGAGISTAGEPPYTPPGRELTRGKRCQHNSLEPAAQAHAAGVCWLQPRWASPWAR